jgi:hypothetical protein
MPLFSNWFREFVMATLDVQVDERLVHDEEATCAHAHMDFHVVMRVPHRDIRTLRKAAPTRTYAPTATWRGNEVGRADKWPGNARWCTVHASSRSLVAACMNGMEGAFSACWRIRWDPENTNPYSSTILFWCYCNITCPRHTRPLKLSSAGVTTETCCAMVHSFLDFFCSYFALDC